MTPVDFQHLCRLARLAPDEAHREAIAAQCSAILAYMDKLAEVDTTGVEPLYSPTVLNESPPSAAAPGGGEAEHPVLWEAGAASPTMREDKAERRRTREEILAGAPETDGTYFVVPRIVEGK